MKLLLFLVAVKFETLRVFFYDSKQPFILCTFMPYAPRFAVTLLHTRNRFLLYGIAQISASFHKANKICNFFREQLTFI